ncbi:Carboxyl-terminal-processing protease [Rhynchospora pubera]|uniref:C-terminal processing peptidase n=2 Tax=Rhynchospora pubera TaxID=906938 RepID=A0AAV8E8C7_9POAL|nr:Carboxyl-terminal-processing protease [Rhynchospora pubera]
METAASSFAPRPLFSSSHKRDPSFNLLFIHRCTSSCSQLTRIYISHLSLPSLYVRKAYATRKTRCNGIDKNHPSQGSYNSSFRALTPLEIITSHHNSNFKRFRSNFIQGAKIIKIACCRGKLKQVALVGFFRMVVGLVFVMAISLTVSAAPSCALTEENLLFLEAWRAVDRAYYDKTFNGQSWFRYRETALKNEPMNTREETYAAIKKMLSTLDDPFTRFLEPEKFKSLRSGTKAALTGVGLSFAYPRVLDETDQGFVVMSSTPDGPADKAGIVPGDIILAIDDISTENMDIYDAADRLQGPEGSSVDLTIRKGSDINHITLKRERVTRNPVKSTLCEIPGAGKESSRVGYIKLTTFNQNASEAVREAINKLRNDNVKAFVLDLRNNSGGLFPQGIEIAKIWLEKGVIVYICDSRGVRDIYEADGANTVAASEPLVVLVNKGTASASEILAGALKDNKRAVLYGEPTFGKGKIQSVFELSDGSGLAVTVARYETPAHTDIDKVGIKPDHPLPMLFPMDEEGFCGCIRDLSAPCNLNPAQLFAKL